MTGAYEQERRRTGKDLVEVVEENNQKRVGRSGHRPLYKTLMTNHTVFSTSNLLGHAVFPSIPCS